MDISVVIPVYNEEKNVPLLYGELKKALSKYKYELIFVDDGSTDKSLEELKTVARDSKVKVIKFRKNFGQSAAWKAGFDNASGDIVITMDSDLQNDPKDIHLLLEKLGQGYDVVSGWRKDRKDGLAKRSFSLISRVLRRFVIKDNLHDSGCSLKAYRKECLENLEMQGELHRYITEMLALQGYKVCEVVVSHRPRKHGKTKYNLIRLQKGFLDLLLVAFWQKYSTRPLHLFGGLGLLMSLFGFVIGAYLLYLKFFFMESISNRPLLLLSALLVIIGVQFIIFGMLADILTKLYYSGPRKPYSIETILK